VSLGCSEGANTSPDARSPGGVPGGVSGARSHPAQGPRSDAAKKVASDKRVIWQALLAGWRPGPDFHERLLELAHRGSLAQGLVIGIDATAGCALAARVTSFHVGFDLVAHGCSLGHTGHLLPVA
jgi:hypothetical protein